MWIYIKEMNNNKKEMVNCVFFFFLHIKGYLEKIIIFLKQNSKVFWVVITKMAVQLLYVIVTNRP